LQREGYEALGMRGGRSALTYLCRGGRADLIIFDLVMPDMDGWAFRRAQLSDPWLADIPVIAVTALGDRHLKGISADAVLQKPLDLPLLLRTVEDVCSRTSTNSLDCPK
jgi:CheY-like chemotaxis protein